MFPSNKDGNGSSVDLTNYYTKTEVDTIINEQGQAYIPCAAIIAFNRLDAPNGFLACDGSEYLKSTYPKLASILAALDTANSTTLYVGSDTNHFKVPDLRGEFLRGTGTNGHSGQGSGGDVGEHQDGTEHVDQFVYGNQIGVYIKTYSGDAINAITNNQDSTGGRNYYVATASGTNASQVDNNSGPYTSRPTNTSVLFCIAVKDIYIDYALDGFPCEITNPQDKQGLTFDATTQKWVNSAGGLHEYSTTEKMVGTWIDGRPVYEIVLVGTLPTTSTDGVLVTNVAANLPSDAKNLVKLESIWYGDAGATTWSGAFPVIDTMYSAGLGFTNIFCANDGSVRISNSVVRYSGRRVYIIISYTKTTDTIVNS